MANNRQLARARVAERQGANGAVTATACDADHTRRDEAKDLCVREEPLAWRVGARGRVECQLTPVAEGAVVFVVAVVSLIDEGGGGAVLQVIQQQVGRAAGK